MGKRIYKGLKAFVLVIVVGTIAWCTVQWIKTPTVIIYEEVGVIVGEDKVVPAQITLSGDHVAKVYVANASGKKSVTVTIDTEKPVKVEVGTEKATVVELSRKTLRGMDGKKLKVEGMAGETVFAVQKRDAKNPPVASGDIAVVLTETGAAPKRLLLRKGAAVTLFVALTGSEVGYDLFVCEELKVNANLENGKVAKVLLTPDKTGQFLFTGTVTPDSRIEVQVVE